MASTESISPVSKSAFDTILHILGGYGTFSGSAASKSATDQAGIGH